MIIFLSCGKSKRETECMAKDMYIGDLFKKSYAYAKSLNPKKIYILSAKYGVLDEETIISPYNKTLNKMGKKEANEWHKKVYYSLKDKGIDFNEKAVFLCGNSYRRVLVLAFKNNYIPIEGLSFGNQLKFYKEHI